MKKFKFSLVSLLKLRERQVDMAEIAYLKSLNEVKEEEKILYGMYESLEGSFVQGMEIRKSDQKPSPKLDIIDDYQKGAKIKIQEQSDKVRRKKQILEKNMDLLKEAEKNKKIIEKLREKEQEEFKKDYNKRVMKATDDLVMSRFVRKNGSFKS